MMTPYGKQARAYVVPGISSRGHLIEEGPGGA